MLYRPDFGVPRDQATADEQICGAFERTRAGQRVEIACIGGHGRTGTVLACMAILAGVPLAEAVSWVRAAYCERADQEPLQQYWIDKVPVILTMPSAYWAMLQAMPDWPACIPFLSVRLRSGFRSPWR